MNKLPAFPKWKAPKRKPHPPTNDKLNDLIAAREEWATARIIGWHKRGLQSEDYDFRSWAHAVPVGVEHGHFGLRLGVCYEYARESCKLRGLLLLADPERKREPWELPSMTFAGLTEDVARGILCEMFDALARLATPLANNLSFAELWRTDQNLVEQVIKDGTFWRSMRVRHGITSTSKLTRGAPVELAWAEERNAATASDTMARGEADPKKGDSRPAIVARQIKDGKEVVVLRLDWKNFRDEQLKERFGEMVKWLRCTKKGGGKVPPEPEPEKQGKKATVLDKALNCLRAARVLDYCHGKTLDSAWEILGVNKYAANKNEANYYRAAKAFRREFAETFPFEGEPAHTRTPKRKRL